MSDQDIVFTSVLTGGRIVDIRAGFLNACKRAGITGLHFHDLRHTFASQFMMVGGDLYVLKEILGHKSLAMTTRYSVGVENRVALTVHAIRHSLVSPQ